MRKEWFARFLILALLLVAVTIPAVAWRVQSQDQVIHARMAETGGWQPENLKAEVGKPLHLRLTSDDVMHGFALGQSDLPPVDVKPGEISEVTLTFDKPGKYTFYCTRWCSINHWRMRGVIEVTGPETGTQATAQPPLFVTLGLDIDASHLAAVVPELRPSAARGQRLGAPLPAVFQSRQYYLTHSPEELWQALRAETALSGYTDQDIWDLVAWAWSLNATPQAVQQGQALYAANCAACHGEAGAGDGVFAAELAGPQIAAHTEMVTGTMTTQPTDFTDPAAMLSASPAHLQGKIIRGGMGTGMPYWGPLFTDEQTWALVAYLWTFQFDWEK